MIVQKEIKIDNVYYMYTYSDEGHYISREGSIYADALDPHFLGREYEETAEKFLNEEQNMLLLNQAPELFE